MSSPPKGRRPTARRLARSRARSRRASPSRSICRASGSSFPARPPAPAADRPGSPKLGEDITETLEVVPRQWKVLQYVREKFTCRACEKISQAPAPFHVLPRGFAGPSLLAMVLFEKYGQHQPLNRQSERYRREGVDLSLSTLADQVGGCAALLRPLYDLIRAHVLAGEPRARRRHHRAGSRQRADDDGSGLGLCARRPAVRRARPAGGGVPLLP